MGIDVFVADEQSERPVDLHRWARLAEAVLADEGVTGDTELSVLFVDERSMSDLNRRFAGDDTPTDVLAFPIDDEPVESGRWPDAGGSGPGWVAPEPSELPRLLGDVVICPEVAWRNSVGEDATAARSAGARGAPPESPATSGQAEVQSAPIPASGGADEDSVARPLTDPDGAYQDELALLVVHGILHLQGMDHEDDEEAGAMRQREQELLERYHRGRPEGVGPEGAGMEAVAPGRAEAQEPAPPARSEGP
jgi:probable rRNA maturation factor